MKKQKQPNAMHLGDLPAFSLLLGQQTDGTVVVRWCIYKLAVVQLHLVRHHLSFWPARVSVVVLQDYCWTPPTSSAIARNPGPYVKSQVLRTSLARLLNPGISFAPFILLHTELLVNLPHCDLAFSAAEVN
jgi:hypothetical protein